MEYSDHHGYEIYTVVVETWPHGDQREVTVATTMGAFLAISGAASALFDEDPDVAISRVDVALAHDASVSADVHFPEYYGDRL